MIFSKEDVKAILVGKKTQTRKLVKKGEHAGYDMAKGMFIDWTDRGQIKGSTISTVRKGNAFSNQLKWQVGRDYAVQLGRGKPRLWKCSQCECVLYHMTGLVHKIVFGKYKQRCCFHNLEPLRIKLTGICKERLLDISESDAKKEGFETIGDFVKVFQHVNWDKCGVDPEVWVLDFEVKK